MRAAGRTWQRCGGPSRRPGRPQNGPSQTRPPGARAARPAGAKSWPRGYTWACGVPPAPGHAATSSRFDKTTRKTDRRWRRGPGRPALQISSQGCHPSARAQRRRPHTPSPLHAPLAAQRPGRWQWPSSHHGHPPAPATTWAPWPRRAASMPCRKTESRVSTQDQRRSAGDAARGHWLAAMRGGTRCS